MGFRGSTGQPFGRRRQYAHAQRRQARPGCCELEPERNRDSTKPGLRHCSVSGGNGGRPHRESGERLADWELGWRVCVGGLIGDVHGVDDVGPDGVGELRADASDAELQPERVGEREFEPVGDHDEHEHDERHGNVLERDDRDADGESGERVADRGLGRSVLCSRNILHVHRVGDIESHGVHCLCSGSDGHDHRSSRRYCRGALRRHSSRNRGRRVDQLVARWRSYSHGHHPRSIHGRPVGDSS